MTRSSSFVSDDYDSARQRFLSEAKERGATHRYAKLAEQGPHGGELYIDAAHLGQTDARKVLVHLSGVHGAEGFIGSAIQSVALRERFVIPKDTALVFVHAVNPYGFAWLRRTNEHNVDLNRNGLSAEQFAQRISEPYQEYVRVSERLGIERATFDFRAYSDNLTQLIAEWGEAVVKQALAGGQYAHPKGLFYGGTELQQSTVMLKGLLEEFLGHADTVCAIDVHSGLGPRGLDSLLVEHDAGEPRLQWLREAFPFRLTPSVPDAGIAYRTSGLLLGWLEKTFGVSKWHSVVQEFGTEEVPAVLAALIEENIWHHHDDGSNLEAACKVKLKKVFCPDDPSWEAAVIDRGLLMIYRALNRLRI
jgi:hypothetical protein